MALFHLSVTQTKRSAGQSAIASAAYRAGERLYSEYYGEYSDYTRKGGVICSDILLPSHAPPEYADRQTLWNAAEKAERGKNAQLAYSFTGGLSKSELRVFVCAARKRKCRTHLRVEVSGIYADDHGHKGCEDDGGTHRADNLRAGCEQANADDSADRNGNGFTHTKRAFQHFILGCAHKDILLAIKFPLCGDRS